MHILYIHLSVYLFMIYMGRRAHLPDVLTRTARVHFLLLLWVKDSISILYIYIYYAYTIHTFICISIYDLHGTPRTST